MSDYEIKQGIKWLKPILQEMIGIYSIPISQNSLEFYDSDTMTYVINLNPTLKLHFSTEMISDIPGSDDIKALCRRKIQDSFKEWKRTPGQMYIGKIFER